jgi:hypothetical protein
MNPHMRAVEFGLVIVAIAFAAGLITHIILQLCQSAMLSQQLS